LVFSYVTEMIMLNLYQSWWPEVFGAALSHTITHHETYAHLNGKDLY